MNSESPKFDGISLSVKAGQGKVSVNFQVPENVKSEDLQRFELYLEEVRLRVLVWANTIWDIESNKHKQK